jgi:hypothetical protein
MFSLGYADSVRMERPMRKSFIVAKFALAALGSIKRVQRVDIPLSLTDFGLMTVFTQDDFEKIHDITRHGDHPLQTPIQ